jgi:SAM-dependent methyltransferase
MKDIIKSLIPFSWLNLYRFYTGKAIELKYPVPSQFKGDKVQCNMCGAKFKAFGPFGLAQRENALCFKCGSLERHRILWKFINEEINLFDRRRIKLLHFAPESFYYEVFDKEPNIEYYPGDLFPEIYKFKGKAQVERIDVTDLQFECDFFDVIICNHVLEHIPDDKKAMEELFRVLKPGGIGIFMVPLNSPKKPEEYDDYITYEDFSITSKEGREKAFGQHDHVRVYGNDFKVRLKNVGFIYNEVDYLKKLTKEELFSYGFANECDLVPYCTKIVDTKKT